MQQERKDSSEQSQISRIWFLRPEMELRVKTQNMQQFREKIRKRYIFSRNKNAGFFSMNEIRKTYKKNWNFRETISPFRWKPC